MSVLESIGDWESGECVITDRVNKSVQVVLVKGVSLPGCEVRGGTRAAGTSVSSSD